MFRKPSVGRILYAVVLFSLGLSLCLFARQTGEIGALFLPGLFLTAGLTLTALFAPNLPEGPSLLWLLLTPFFCFYCLESMTHDPWEMEFLPQLINLLFYVLVLLLFLAVTGKSRIAVPLTALIFFLMGIANYYTMEFRDSPILPWDLASLGTALTVTDNYSFTVPSRLFLLILFFLGIAVIGERTSLELPRKGIRLKTGAASLIFTALLYLALQFSAVTDNLLTFSNLFTQWATYRDNGFVVSFITNMRYMNVEKPDDYRETLAKLADRLMNEAQNTSSDTSGDRPHIIVVMNEAFSDLSVIHEFSTDVDYMPNVRALMEDPGTISGNLYVSVRGGNTANTEFEFLTGDTCGFLPSGSVAYQQYIKNVLPSYASTTRLLGYDPIALHPYYASGWDRDEVYPRLGFEVSLFRSNFPNPELIRSYISDRTVYERMISLYEHRTVADPLFLFSVTMQNHGGYSKLHDNFPISVRITEERTFEATEHYLSLVRESDIALGELIDYFSQVPEDTVILFFGDHQPGDYVTNLITRMTGLAVEDMTLKQQQDRYVVPFLMWANFDLEGAGTRYEALSPNYLSSVLSRAAGLPLTPYQNYLLELSETLPVITANAVADRDGNFYSLKETGDYEQLLHEYAVLQYNHLFDKKGRIDKLFLPIQ